MNLFEKDAWIDDKATILEHDTAEAVLFTATQAFPKITLACSFGAEDVVLVDMIQKLNAEANIFYLDTGLHFAETYETKDELERFYNKSFIRVLPKLTLEEQAASHGEELWKSNPNLCCKIRKVDPLSDILSGYHAWVTGIRRDQAPTRANTKKVEYDTKFGLVKFNPLANWTTADVWNYIREHGLYYNPLHDHNYPSIGCEKCTRPVFDGEDPRAGRWADFEKTECGLHK